jgi:hypothetical protein
MQLILDLNTGSYSSTATGTATGNSVNLGTITACGNTINTNGVYIAGGIDNNAVLWKDGVPTFLTNNPVTGNKSAAAIRSLVYNNDTYVLVGEYDSTVNGWVSTIKLWKNGVPSIITNGTTTCEPSGLDVYNNDIYISGTESDVNGNRVGKFWKNGIATVLPKDTFDWTEVTNIKIINGDVYVIGYGTKINQSVATTALYWKNGTLNLLPHVPGSNSEAFAIFANNGDIYISGSEYTSAFNGVYWKNGIKTTLPTAPGYTNSDGYSIFVDNTDVYVAGATNQNQGSYFSNAIYWKNNNINFLTNSTVAGYSADIYDIFVKNNVVYTVGEVSVNNNGGGGYTPLYFQNNVAVPLTGFTNTQDVFCYSVFVK